MTQKEIFINYDNVRRQIKELNLIADEYETVISDLRNSVNRTYGFWEGEAAEAYRVNLQNHIKELQKMKNKTELLARELQQMLNEFQQKEEMIKHRIARI